MKEGTSVYTFASHGLRDVKQNVKILSVCIHKSTHRLLDLYVDCVIDYQTLPQYRILFFDPLECAKEAIHVICFDPLPSHWIETGSEICFFA